MYKKWSKENKLFIDKNKNLLELNLVKNKEKRESKKGSGFNFYFVKTKRNEVKETNSIIANLVQSFDALIVLNLIKLCFAEKMKFYHIFDCFLINEADYFTFMDIYIKAFKNVFENSGQYDEYILSLYNNIEDLLNSSEKVKFKKLF